MPNITFEQLLEAGVHFGHITSKRNPKMQPYIFTERNGIHIIDLLKTKAKLEEAVEVARKIARSGRTILFVATKKQIKESVETLVKETNMPFVTERWPGGMLTNFPTIRKAIKKMSNIDKMEEDGTLANLSKRERLQISRQRAKLEKNLGSIADMTKLPAAIFVVDVEKEYIAVNEANKLGIPVFAIVDTCCDPSNVDYLIPGNDDAVKSVEIILKEFVEAVKQGQQERKIEREAAKKEEATKSAEQAAASDDE